MACSLPHTDSEVKALVQRLINEDKGRQDALLNFAFQFDDSCAVRDDLRKTYEKCNDISQESRALIWVLNRITRTVVEGTVVSEQDELPSSIGLDFQARLDGGRMNSGHLEAK
ncbi:hypothetical protein Tco_0513245 [Tanacetum coccineum]